VFSPDFATGKADVAGMPQFDCLFDDADFDSEACKEMCKDDIDASSAFPAKMSSKFSAVKYEPVAAVVSSFLSCLVCI
jgi:hypothetical protein